MELRPEASLVIRKLFEKYYERTTVGGGEEGQGWEQGGLQVTAAARTP